MTCTHLVLNVSNTSTNIANLLFVKLSALWKSHLLWILFILFLNSILCFKLTFNFIKIYCTEVQTPVNMLS